MPKYLAEEQIGLLRVIVSYSTLLAQFAGLGFSIVAVRMFPYFRDSKTHHHGFLSLFLIASLVVALSVFRLIESSSLYKFKPLLTLALKC